VPSVEGVAGSGLEGALSGARRVPVAKEGTRERADGDPALLKACREFEALFVREVLERAGGTRALRGSLLCSPGESGPAGAGDDLDLPSGSGFYADEALEAMARSLASGGCLGLAEMLYRQLSGREPTGAEGVEG
jgi:Rod binding domain-containing protein